MGLVHSLKIQSKSDLYSHFSLFSHLFVASFVTIVFGMNLRSFCHKTVTPEVLFIIMNDVLQKQQNKLHWP